MNLEPLLSLIRKYESRGDYNVVWGRISSRHYPPKKLTQMTVREVLDWQDSIDRLYMSEAAGAYQILEDTLRDLVEGGAVTLGQRFDENTQDYLAECLLRRRGLDNFLKGKLPPEKFALAIAKEWASFPVPYDITRKDGKVVRRGQSYYTGDSLNSAHASVDEVLVALSKVRQPTPVAPETKPGFMETLARLFSKLFGKD